MKRYLKGVVLIIAIGVLTSIGVFSKYKNDIETARRNYIQEEQYKTRQVAARVEKVFQTIYEGLRIIARLPGIKNIDRYAENLDVNARRAVQEIYRNVANNVALSEIYIVPLEFDPARFDERLGKLEQPIVMLDDLITGRTALTRPTETFLEKRPPEFEIEEYRLLTRQLAWMKENVPREVKPMDLAVPAITGPEVMTCDNTRFNPLAPDDRDRMGLVYSLPLYDYPGQLKGAVTGVLLTRVLESYLPSADYVIGNQRNGYRVTKDPDASKHVQESEKWIQQFAPNPFLIYSETVDLRIVDEDNPWYLWAGQPNALFWQRQDVRMAKQFAMLGFMGVFLLTGGSIFGYFLSCRHRDHLETMNQELVKHQSLLEESQNRLKRFSGALLSVREEEKRKLSRDLHDTVGSMAIGLNARLKVLEDSIKGDRKNSALENVTHVKQAIKSFVGSFKHIALSLRPPQLEDVGFCGALEEYCEEIAKVQPLKFELDLDIDDETIPDDLSIALYRVVQEALNNIIKHSRADQVAIRLNAQDGAVHLMISDDGIGFNSKESGSGSTGIGIIGIRERIESFRGQVEIDSCKGQGTRILITVPLSHPQKV